MNEEVKNKSFRSSRSSSRSSSSSSSSSRSSSSSSAPCRVSRIISAQCPLLSTDASSGMPSSIVETDRDSEDGQLLSNPDSSSGSSSPEVV